MLTWVAAAVVATLALTRLLGGPDGASPPQVPVKVAAAGGGAERSRGDDAYVHVAGAVRRPGLYRLPPSARVAVALERAGGPRPKANLAAVNLASRVEDGQQIVVPLQGAAAAAEGGGRAAGPAGAVPGAAGSKLSLASATLEQLEQLDGIGPTLAKRILEFRDSKGGFRSVGQLREVDGIGEKRFEALRDAVGP